MATVIIKAGGIGSRMNSEIPKQFIVVNRKPIIIYTLEAFERHELIDRIVIACVEDWIDTLWGFVDSFGIKKVSNIVPGGSTSLRSIKNGVRCIEKTCNNEEELVLIHDANRPLVSSEIISDVIEEALKYGTAVAAIQCTDEIMKSYGDSKSSLFLNRKELFRIQTPDAYRLQDIKWLLEQATDEDYDYVGATNTLWVKHGGTMHFADGSELNIRLTRKEDISLFEAILNLSGGNNDS